MKLKVPLVINGNEYTDVIPQINISENVTTLIIEDDVVIREGLVSQGMNISLIPITEDFQTHRDDMISLTKGMDFSQAEQDCFDSIISAIEKLMSK